MQSVLYLLDNPSHLWYNNHRVTARDAVWRFFMKQLTKGVHHIAIKCAGREHFEKTMDNVGLDVLDLYLNKGTALTFVLAVPFLYSFSTKSRMVFICHIDLWTISKAKSSVSKSTRVLLGKIY